MRGWHWPGPAMVDHLCADCQFRELRFTRDTNKHEDWCASPQIKAAYGFKSATRCLFERDSYTGEHRKAGDDARKCGPDAINFIARVT